MPDDLYNVLGVDRNASQEDIKKAFRKKAVQCHPDKHPGDASKEEEFKRLNDAYMVLSDQDKRSRYDMFGETDDMGAGGVPMADIFKGMFGMDIGGAGGGPGNGGFSFVFMGDGPQDPHQHIFEQMFGGGGGGRGGPPQRKPVDAIDVPIELHDVFHGTTKKVEFELLDQCHKCNGTGASDPSAVINCMTCNGSGRVAQQMGPFFVQSATCPNCGGKGNTIRANKVCTTCKGQRTHFTKRMFELKIPKGIPNHYEIKMDDKGSYDERLKGNRDMLFRFVYAVPSNIALEMRREGGGTEPVYDVVYTLPITLEDVLAGFEKKINLYKDEYTIKSEAYFNPSNPFVVEGKGLPCMKRANRQGNLIFKFVVEFNNNEKLRKHNEVMRKVLKRPQVSGDAENDKTIIVN